MTPAEKAACMTIQKKISDLFSAHYSNNALSIVKIQGDASSRQYFRVTGTDGSTIACYDPAYETATPDTYPFLLLHSLLSRHAIPVPALITTDSENGLLLLEDCGDLLLQNVFGSSLEHTVPNRYREIIDILIQLQSLHGQNNRIPFSISFDHEKLMFEFDFFIRDSYVKLSPSLTEELKNYHYNALHNHGLTTMSLDEYLFYFDIMAFQRNIKAIGTFCYQTMVKKNSAFQHSISPTLSYLPDYINARKELKTAGKILQTLLDDTAS